MLLQLNPPIPLDTPKGKALAWMCIDYGAEHNLMWVCAIDATGEIWTFSNPEVRAQTNVTMGRKADISKLKCEECNHTWEKVYSAEDTNYLLGFSCSKCFLKLDGTHQAEFGLVYCKKCEKVHKKEIKCK